VGWVRLDDGFPRNPKVLGLSDRAFRASIEAMCYAAEYDTDGILPGSYLRGVRPSVMRELIEAGLWDEEHGLISVHDYLAYNPSSMERGTRTDASRTAARMRWASASHSESHPTSTRGRVGDGLGTGKTEQDSAGFDAFWAVYPRKVGKPKALAAYRRCVRDGARPSEIFSGAERLRDDPNRVEQFTPHPTTWLNREGWNDPQLPSRNGQGREETITEEELLGQLRGDQ
jgi:hypothetical protein